MTDSERKPRSGSTSAPVQSDSATQDHGSSLANKHSGYRVPNRSVVEALEIQPLLHTQVSSCIVVTKDYGEEGYHQGTVASETAPGHFQETRILPPSEVRQRAYQALRRAEQRRSQLREEEACFLSGEDE